MTSPGRLLLSTNLPFVDEVEFIERVLCRISLPDRDVYPALAGVRDARRGGIKEQIEQAIWQLAGVFVTAVRQGLDNPTTFVNFWVLLRNQGELQKDPELFKLLNYLTGRLSTRKWLNLPDDFNDEGGSGVGARRRPTGPRPSLSNENQPPPGFQ